MVSETTPVVLANGHDPRWPLTSLPGWGPGRTHGRGGRRPHPPGPPSAPTKPRVEAEPTAVVGAGRTGARPGGRPSATASGGGCWRPRPGTWSSPPEAPRRVVLPRLVGAAPPGRPGAVRGGGGGVFAPGSPPARSDDLVRAPWAPTAAPARAGVPRTRADLDHEVAALRDRSLAGQRFGCVLVDATCCKARVNRRVVAQRWWSPPGVRRRPPRGPRLRRRRRRGRRLLDRVAAVAGGPRAGWGAAGGRRRPPGAAPGRGRGGGWRCRVHLLPNVLAQVQGLGRDGRRRGPHPLRPARRHPRP
jgi:hypothetical protein